MKPVQVELALGLDLVMIAGNRESDDAMIAGKSDAGLDAAAELSRSARRRREA